METLVERGGLARVPELLRRLGGSRVLVLTSPSRRFLDRLEPLLSGFGHAVFDGAAVHVPRATVDAAERAIEALDADALLALGGGSAIGLAKALRLRRELAFVAVPTTYSGSEQTSIWGMTDAGDKRTGRDPRVRPDAIVYDPELLATLPARVALQSAMNALAHPLSALSTGTLDAEDARDARAVAADLIEAIDALAAMPDALDARERALLQARQAARVLDGATLGAHHKLAHALGGRFELEHAALHSVLLPQTLAEQLPTGARARLLAAMHALSAPTSLPELGVDPAAARALLAERPELAALGDALERALGAGASA